LLLVDNEAIRQLNREYRNIDSPTDVLSFALQEKTEEEPDIYFDEEDTADDNFPEELGNMLGDIVISVERAREQAAEYGHSLEREMVFLAVHGTLHLLGYDHDTEEQTRSMREMEEKIMNSIGLAR
jgi:probable rRNA maturation factor